MLIKVDNIYIYIYYQILFRFFLFNYLKELTMLELGPTLDVEWEKQSDTGMYVIFINYYQ